MSLDGLSFSMLTYVVQYTLIILMAKRTQYCYAAQINYNICVIKCYYNNKMLKAQADGKYSPQGRLLK